jgi:apolipoprotein N-acyltransferase
MMTLAATLAHGNPRRTPRDHPAHPAPAGWVALMLHDILYWLLVFVVGGIGIIIFGTLFTVVIGIGGLIAQAGFLILWERDWFKVVSVVTGILLVVGLLELT